MNNEMTLDKAVKLSDEELGTVSGGGGLKCAKDPKTGEITCDSGLISPHFSAIGTGAEKVIERPARPWKPGGCRFSVLW